VGDAVSWTPHAPTRGVLKGQYFATQQQYQNALARTKGFRSYADMREAPASTRSGALKPRAVQSRRMALRVLQQMRHFSLSLAGAARNVGIAPSTVKRYASSGLQRERRQYRPTSYDRMSRTMVVLTAQGTISLTIRDSRTASKIGSYWVAVERYLQTGNTDRLMQFRGKFFRVDKQAYPFITDTTVLDQLGGAGVLRFDDIYDNSPAT
jgi:hypothetical protein